MSARREFGEISLWFCVQGALKSVLNGRYYIAAYECVLVLPQQLDAVQQLLRRLVQNACGHGGENHAGRCGGG